MAIQTKIKIYKTGKVEAGQFVEGSEHVLAKVNSDLNVKELDEISSDVVKIKADGTLTAPEFEEV
jgi:dihydroorotate dehydrogenase